MDARIDHLFNQIIDEKYIVLRNWNELLEPNFSTEHDIDILCEDPKSIIKKLALKPRPKKDDCIHYLCNDIKIDLWNVESGYYCENWSRSAIQNRRILNKKIYIPDETDALYLLIYHALIQKKELPEKYKEEILSSLKKHECAPTQYDRLELLKILEDYMMNKSYRYTYSRYGFSNVYLENVNKNLIKKSFRLKTKKVFYSAINSLKGKVYRVVKWARK